MEGGGEVGYNLTTPHQGQKVAKEYEVINGRPRGRNVCQTHLSFCIPRGWWCLGAWIPVWSVLGRLIGGSVAQWRADLSSDSQPARLAGCADLVYSLPLPPRETPEPAYLLHVLTDPVPEQLRGMS